MNKCRNLSKISEYKRPKRPRITPTVSTVKTVVRPDGLVESVVEFTEQPKDQYRDQNWRNFQVQTIIQTGATDLLKELDPLSVNPLAASDGVSRVSVSLSDLNDALVSYRQRLTEQSKLAPSQSETTNS